MTAPRPDQAPGDTEPTCIASRYDVLVALGRGGMGGAYQVRDRTTGEELALKRLIEPGRQGTVVELFEREFHTLTQLAHPRIVRAFDYGFDPASDGDHAYYTMELLDGGDLRELSPLPWQEVCAAAYDVCSALSLLHSRRMVHKDLTPRNIRRTADGTAKLIDFGLLDTFGPSNMVAGTPPYVAPELMNKVSLDARSDLFSLGATLYFALTGRFAFRVARFEQLRDAWRGTPVSPRKLVPEIPEALDQLVMAMLRVDVGSRPRSAAEVMDRVAPLMAQPPDESLAVAGAYLTAPQQVGRDELKRASGYHDWIELSDIADPTARGMQAFVRASQRYEATHEHERVQPPAEAIKGMVAYVVYSIAIGARTMRPALHASLPGLLEPFATLNPVVEAMRLNAEATYCGYLGQREEGRERLIALVDVIDGLEGDTSFLLEKVRVAVCQAIAAREAVLGIAREDPDRWLRYNEPNQRVGAEYIRKVAALHRGDWEAAESHRRKAEVIALQHDTAPMFSTLTEEFETHALARDLTGLRRVRARIRASIARSPRWRLTAAAADAYHHYLCGQPDAAMEIIARLRAQSERAERPFGLQPLLEAVAVEILLDSGDVEEALALGSRALTRCEAAGQRSFARILALPVALAEARLGNYGPARVRAGKVIEAQDTLGVSGLLMGRAFEYLARCALAEGDRQAFLSASADAAKHYRPGRSQVLGALHERLMEDARRAGLIDGTTGIMAHESRDRISELASHLSVTFMRCQDASERAAAALAILREAASSNTAYLFLLSEAGLTLSAVVGNAPANTSEMRTFAQAQIELEQDNDVVTMTAALETTEAGELPTEMHDGNGRCLHPQTLITGQDGELLLAGVALLAEPEPHQPLGPVAEAVAKHLIESGDCKPIIAA